MPFRFLPSLGVENQVLNHLPWPKSGHYVLQLGNLVRPEAATVWGPEAICPNARTTRVSDAMNSAATVVERYTRPKLKLNKVQISLAVAKLWEGLSQWVDLEKLAGQYEEENLPLHLAEFVRIHEPRQGTRVFINKTEVNDWNDMLQVRGFMKQQSKAALDAFAKRKCGQGISAWDKTINVVFCAAVRELERVFKAALKPGVVFANGLPESRLSDIYLAHRREGDQYLANDFSEFDSTQGVVTTKLEQKLWRHCGLPAHLVSLYGVLRASWRIKVPGVASVQNGDMRHSGEPFTLLGNTAVNMAVSGVIMQCQGFSFAGFKGDDSIVTGPHVHWDHAEEQWVRDNVGMLCKPETGGVPEFVGYYLTDRGFMPNILRIAAKVISRNNSTHLMAEYQLALRDSLSMVRTAGDEDVMLLANQIAHGRPYVDIKILYDGLKRAMHSGIPVMPRISFNIDEDGKV